MGATSPTKKEEPISLMTQPEGSIGTPNNAGGSNSKEATMVEPMTAEGKLNDLSKINLFKSGQI